TKKDLSEQQVEKIKSLFKGYSDSELAEILADNILNTEEFDNLSLGLFSKIIDAGKHSVVASLATDALNEHFSEDREKLQGKVKKLISASEKDSVSEVYRNTLSLFLEDISYEKKFYLDRDSAQANYRLILISFILDEKNKSWLNTITQEIIKILEGFTKQADFVYLKLLTDILKEKKAQGPQQFSAFEQLENKIIVFLENAVLTQQVPDDSIYILDYLKASSIGIEPYLKRIFTENVADKVLLKMLFKLFPEASAVFFEELEKKYSDMEFIHGISRSLKEINNTAALEILKKIYNSDTSNNYIKIGVLKNMRELDLVDKEFLMPILEKSDIIFKKEALSILSKDAKTKHEALSKLFYIKGRWWKINKMLMDNIIVVGEIGLKDAKEYLQDMAKRPFFWNKSIRRKAEEVLARWR
ncbi:MAG: hypothetical protein JW788_00015, partial [Candidatus Omnitrophica bacterium]|nr:hypothetical protein [Candidatus Omnitrophota bacterium]